MALTKLTDKTVVSSVNLTDGIHIVQGNSEKVIPVQKVVDIASAAASAAAQTALNPSILDGVYIMYHRKSDDFPVISTVDSWTALQTSGEIADGVLVLQGGKHLVVAPTETNKYFSSSPVLVGAAVTDRVVAMNDWNGKSLTAALIANSTLAADGDGYAPGWCHAYSRSNANGKGLTAGKWFMPAGGQGMFMLGNKRKINLALAQINGATPLSDNAYWMVSETSAANAWNLSLDNGRLIAYTKVSDQGRVRAVAEFIQ